MHRTAITSSSLFCSMALRSRSGIRLTVAVVSRLWFRGAHQKIKKCPCGIYRTIVGADTRFSTTSEYGPESNSEFSERTLSNSLKKYEWQGEFFDTVIYIYNFLCDNN